MSSPSKLEGISRLKESKFWSEKPGGNSRGKSRSQSGLLLLRLQLPFECPETSDLVLRNVNYRSKVSQIKVRLEQELGILPDMYFLSYLDSVPMEDSSRLCDHDIVNRGTLRINVWRLWQDLLIAVLKGNIKDCFDCSLNISGSSGWSKYCAWAALYVAAHHGHHNLAAELLKRTTLAVNSTSPCGWNVLHAAARKGRWKVVCMLVDNGVDVRTADLDGITAYDLSRTYGHKKCENSLAFCQWNLQKHRTVQERKLDYDALHDRQLTTRLAHQLVDSSLQIDYRGLQGQLYRTHIANPVTVAKVKKFQDRRLENPLAKEKLQVKLDEELSCRDTNGKLDFNYGWFDGLRAQQLIPSTRDIIRYSDPSSCELRPHSLLNPGGFKVRLYTPPAAPVTLSAARKASGGKASGGSGTSKSTLFHSHPQPLGKVGGAANFRTRTPKVEVTHA